MLATARSVVHERADVVVVTENGYENFTGFLPSELNDLENAVKQRGGIVQKFPAGMPKGER